MPTEKRARQRAGRQARLEALAQHQRRRRQVRTSVIVLVIAAVVVGSVYLITRPKPKPTATFPDTPQGRLEHIWVNNGCPESTTTRVNTQQYSTVPPNTLNASATYEATVRTDVGSFVISMNPKVSPIAVNSFVFLANRGFFSCVIFHRVIQGFVNQTGDPTGTGTGGPGYQFTEAGPAKASPQYPIGSVVLANSDNPGTTMPKTNGSQWFVVTGAQGEALPPYYVLFGQVTSGMSVLDTINSNGAPASSQAGKPTVTHRILTVKIKEVPSS